jgi:hypothetical protein
LLVGVLTRVSHSNDDEIKIGGMHGGVKNRNAVYDEMDSPQLLAQSEYIVQVLRRTVARTIGACVCV